MKKFLSLILLYIPVLTVLADDVNWKIHPIFDEQVSHVVETPDFVYFTSRNLMENKTTDTNFSLFRYDKRGDELIPLSVSNILNGNGITDVVYNPSKGYLAVLYKDFNIDFLYNDGSVVNFPYYRQASFNNDKSINSMTIDAEKDRLYLATVFGYISINDVKHEIAESRLHSESFKAMSRLGQNYLFIKGNDLFYAPTSSHRMDLDDYIKIASFNNPIALHTLSENIILMTTGISGNNILKSITMNGEDFEVEDILNGNIINIENNPAGVTITTDLNIYQINKTGEITVLDLPESYQGVTAGTLNMSEIWTGLKRKGLSSIKKSGEQWKVTRDWMLPNAPATYESTTFNFNPEVGTIMIGVNYNPVTYTIYGGAPFQLSSYKQGRWKNHSTSYTNPDRATIATAANGVVIDPDNPSYVYITTYHHGFLRLNLNDPNDIIHFSRPGDADNGNPGFVEFPYIPLTNPGYSNIAAPWFDKQGNLWMSYPDWDDSDDPNPHFYCWTAADRRATTSATNVKMPIVVEFDTSMPLTNLGLSIPLLKTGNGLIACSAGLGSNDVFAILNYNGTPTNPSDDKAYPVNTIVDGEGNIVQTNRFRYLWEDPDTGYLWVCHDFGVFYVVPSQVMAGNTTVNKIKVPRNDGTNLADYLLEGVSVNQITSDPDGRKWFATNGAGLICTSADGKEIIQEFNSSNSLLPDDIVYGVGYNPENNSLILSTDQGIAEYFLPASHGESNKVDIKAYPNPVRPEYSGYVTITDIPQGSFVKIVDGAGHLVKELGIMTGFEILWDISDSNFNRVKSGVYHIMVSPSNESGAFSAVGKILVVS